MKAVPLVFVVIFFLELIPLKELEFFRNLDVAVLWSSTLLIIVGFVFLIDFFRNYKDAKSHNGAIGASIIFLIMALATWGYALADITGFNNPFDNAGQENTLNIILVILLGASMVLLYLGVHPEIRHRHTLSKGIRLGKVI